MSTEAMKMALAALDDATIYTSSESWSPSMTEECNRAAEALRRALSAQPPTMTAATWTPAPASTEWGADMLAADVALSADETLTMYATQAGVALIAQPPADPTALCLRLQTEADMWRANGDENLYVLLEEAVAAISQPPAPSVPTSRLLDRAEALHLNAGMPWHQARELALSEIGVDGSAIVELVGECAALGTESLLTGDEICDFTRAVLVHGSALMVTLTSSDQADMRSLLRCAEKVRDWMGDGCNPDETPKPQLAALAEWAGSTASAMLSAAPPPVRERLTDERIREIGETLGAKIPGVSDHASWGCGYRADNTGSHTIPCLPANLVPFARAIERALIGGEG